MYGTYCFGQPKLELTINDNGSERTIASLTNENNSNLSAISLSLISGSGSGEAKANFTTFGENYTATAGFGGYTALSNFNNGFIFRSTEAGGFIRMITGGSNIGNTRLLIADNGNVGLGSSTPSSKLHIQQGDIYLDGNTNNASGIIMESPNGTCYKVTIDNSGSLSSSALPNCPN